MSIRDQPAEILYHIALYVDPGDYIPFKTIFPFIHKNTLSGNPRYPNGIYRPEIDIMTYPGNHENPLWIFRMRFIMHEFGNNILRLMNDVRDVHQIRYITKYSKLTLPYDLKSIIYAIMYNRVDVVKEFIKAGDHKSAIKFYCAIYGRKELYDIVDIDYIHITKKDDMFGIQDILYTYSNLTIPQKLCILSGNIDFIKHIIDSDEMDRKSIGSCIEISCICMNINVIEYFCDIFSKNIEDVIDGINTYISRRDNIRHYNSILIDVAKFANKRKISTVVFDNELSRLLENISSLCDFPFC